MKIHNIRVVNGLRIIEYTTRFNQYRFDIQPWKGEREVRIPFELESGRFEVRTFPITFEDETLFEGEKGSVKLDYKSI